MRRDGWLVLVLIVACGCAEPEPAVRQEETPRPAEVNVPPPSSRTPTLVALISGEDTLRVGDSQSDVQDFYSPPATAHVYKELPPNFQAPYRARVTETAQGGLGAIFYEERLVAAVQQQQNLTFQDVLDERDLYTGALGTPTEQITSANVKYWFWEINDQRLMISATADRSQRNRYDLTTAMGDKLVLDALRMNPADARSDQAQAERNFGAPVSR